MNNDKNQKLNRFELVLAASNRVRELRSGHRSTLGDKNRDCVTALNEIEKGIIGKEYLYKQK
jgi:DNA-directed RNA polymerase subunit K/omega